MATELTVEKMRAMGDMWGKLYLESLSVEERLSGLTPEECLAVLKPEERLAGLTPEELCAGVSPEYIENYLRTLKDTSPDGQ